MKRNVQIVDSESPRFDRIFWMAKSLEERIAALETLRLQYIKLHDIQPRLLRICRITSLK